MPQLVKKRRSGWAVLAAGALIASLFAVGAAPAAAAAIDAKSKPAASADFSACVGPAVADQGFTDLGTLEAAVPKINCLAYYGITAGRTADTYDPNSNVTRSEMALFLYKAAGLAGVDLMGGDMAADYGDVSELGENRQNAIKALARNGILVGRGDMAFEPGADITRAEMAVALVALLDKAPGDKVKKNEAGLYVVAPATAPSESFFADARASVPRSVDNAISSAYELGITSGVGDGSSFNPGGSVPRRDMATFIMNALAHSNLRPAGLTAQNLNGTITVSVRGADFSPVPNQAVDAIRFAPADESLVFNAKGTCTTRAASVDGTAKCAIDNADPVTRTDGNVALAGLGEDDVGKDGVTVWVWHGDVGDKFTSAEGAYELSVPPFEATAGGAVSAAISDSRPKGVTKVRYGETVTVTIQLKDAAAGAGKDAGRGEIGGADGIEYEVSVTERAKADGTDPTTGDTTSRVTPVKVKVADDGSASFTLRASDPSPSKSGNRMLVTYTVSGGDFSGDTPAGPDLSVNVADAQNVIFSDEMSVVTKLTVEAASFQDAPGAGNKAGAAVTVTATDQFGKPFRNAGIVLTGTVSTSEFSTKARFTGPDGRVRIGYTYTGGAAKETLTATVTPEPTGGAVTGMGDAFWVIAWETDTTNNGTQNNMNVLSADLDANQVIIEPTANEPASVNYDSGDFFTVDGEPSSIADFEKRLAEGLKIQKDGPATGSGSITAFTLGWQSYDHEDSSDIASFTLTLTLTD